MCRKDSKWRGKRSAKDCTHNKGGTGKFVPCKKNGRKKIQFYECALFGPVTLDVRVRYFPTCVGCPNWKGIKYEPTETQTLYDR